MKVYIVQHWADNNTQVENIAAFSNRAAAVAFADQMEDNGKYSKSTLFIEDLEILEEGYHYGTSI